MGLGLILDGREEGTRAPHTKAKIHYLYSNKIVYTGHLECLSNLTFNLFPTFNYYEQNFVIYRQFVHFHLGFHYMNIKETP